MSNTKKCKICSNVTKEIISNKFNIVYNYCEICEFISKDDKYLLAKKDELKIYNNHQNSIEDKKYVEYFKKFINVAIIPYIKAGQALDFGSGPEPVLSMILMKDYNFKVDIYDYFYQPIKTYKNKTYDLIVVTEVVEHLEDPIHYFNLFKQHLNKNKFISIMTLFHSNNSADFLNWHYMRDMSHISFYTPKTMEFIARKVGLKIVYCDNYRYITFVNN